MGGKMSSAHVVSYRIFIGPVPPGNRITHTCENKLCVNPEHLKAATFTDIRYPWVREGKLKCGHPRGKSSTCPICHREERIRKGLRVTGFCNKGHDLSKVKVYQYGTAKRHCAICLREYFKQHRLRQIAAGLCAQVSCHRHPLAGKKLCRKHLDLQAVYGSRHWRKSHPLASVKTDRGKP